MDAQEIPTRSTFVDRWFRSIFGTAALGSLMLWLSQPPFALSMVGWIALMPWCWLILRRDLKGRRPLIQFWMAAWMYWLCSLYFIPIPHPALWAGWPLMSALMATYLLLFFVSARRAIWNLKVPAVIAIPACWSAVEWLRTQGSFSFGMALLGHSQIRHPVVIQVADIAGAYGISFVMVTVSAAVAMAWIRRRPSEFSMDHGPSENEIAQRSGLLFAAVLFAIVIVYGSWKTAVPVESLGEQGANTVIVQGSIDTEFPATEEEYERYTRKRVTEYQKLAIKARGTFQDANVLIFPESAFQQPVVLNGNRIKNRDEVQQYLEYAIGDVIFELTERDPITLIAGGLVYEEAVDAYFNAAQVFFSDGKVAIYQKVHCVPFGEYLPLAGWLPIPDSWNPIGRGLACGASPTVFTVSTTVDGQPCDVKLMPSICFESTVPHLVRNQMNVLEDRGERVDYLLNITDDGWFFGTSCLDFHLACNVFRAVETRKPVVVAANTGFSALIDACGRILAQGPRRAEGLLPAMIRPQPINARSPYRVIGDWPWLIATMLGALSLASRFWTRKPR